MLEALQTVLHVDAHVVVPGERGGLGDQRLAEEQEGTEAVSPRSHTLT